jgi:Fe2+-dicitrate sensor, membrane component
MDIRNENMNKPEFLKADFEKLSVGEKANFLANGYRVPQKQSNAATFDVIRERIELGEQVQETPKRHLNFYWAAASIVVVVLAAAFYFNVFTSQPEVVLAERGRHVEYTLPDGSEIKINSDSKISYSANEYGRNRELNLIGEAYFSVKKGAPFVVKTPLGKIEVLGTTFNVFSREKEFNVSCNTGKVKVTVGTQTVIITPGEKVVWADGILKKSSFIDEDGKAGWTTGKFRFDNIPLISIFDEIERQFNVKISAIGIENRFFTGSFSNTRLNEVLETVCLPMNLEYEIKDGNKVSVRPKEK